MSVKLRLGPIPKTETFKLTITLSAKLKTDLDRYSELHSQQWEQSVDVARLIPHILEAFIGRDRAFSKVAVGPPKERLA